MTETSQRRDNPSELTGGTETLNGGDCVVRKAAETIDTEDPTRMMTEEASQPWEQIIESLAGELKRGQMQATSFELATYAIPARWRNSKGEADRANPQNDFAQEVNVSLRPLIEQLPLGAALQAEYEFRLVGEYAINLRCKLQVDRLTVDRTDLHGELGVCLATLSEYYGFRDLNVDKDTSSIYGKTMIIRPVTVACTPHSGALGFTSLNVGGSAVVRLPVPEAASTWDSGPVFPFGPSCLGQTLKAARATRQTLRFRIRLIRERLEGGYGDILRRLLREDIHPNAGGKEGEGHLGQASLTRMLETWVDAPKDVLRVELEAEGLRGQTISTSLLRILASEVFPGRRVEIVAKGPRLDHTSCELNLGSLFPLVGRLPPLLPQPSVLESLEFPRHYSNPTVTLSETGMLLGHVQLGGFEHPVRITETDRSRHLYLLGATGTGKSTLLFNMIRQDMEAGRGIALMDPHGDLFEQVLAAIPSRRVKDVIIIDPSEDDHLVGLNPLDFGGKPDLLKINRVINDLLDIFGDLWNMREAGGPAFEQYFRNILLLASIAPEHKPPDGLPKGAPTLLTATEIMRDKEYRGFLLKRCASSYLGSDVGQEVMRFFKSAHVTEGGHRFENLVPYITSKLTRFTSNPQLRKMLCTPKRTVDFRQVIDQGKIVLVNLNKGRLGEQDTRMVGMLVTKYLFQAALSRSNLPREARRPFYYYLDEFQNFVTPDIPDMLAEARKYGLHLTLAHQTLGQLKDRGVNSTLDAVLGNVATRLIFRVGLQEAAFLEPNFLPHFDAHALAGLPDRHILTRMLVRNKPSAAFVFETMPYEPLDREGSDAGIPARVRYHSSQAYGVIELGENISCGGLTETYGASLPLLRGMLAVSYHVVEAKQARELQDRLDHSIGRWPKSKDLQPVSTLRPEKVKFYLTGNRSLVFVYEVDNDRKGVALVLTGGHRELNLRGGVVASTYQVKASGEYHGEYPNLTLLGMDLVEEVDLALADPEVLKKPIDQCGGWLHNNSPMAELGKLSSGFYRTLNNSVVFVKADTSPTPMARVCRGGHGIQSLNGAEPGEVYQLTAQGQFRYSLEKLKELPSPIVALATGLSLAEYLPLTGDVPSELQGVINISRTEE